MYRLNEAVTVKQQTNFSISIIGVHRLLNLRVSELTPATLVSLFCTLCLFKSISSLNCTCVDVIHRCTWRCSESILAWCWCLVCLHQVCWCSRKWEREWEERAGQVRAYFHWVRLCCVFSSWLVLFVRRVLVMFSVQSRWHLPRHIHTPAKQGWPAWPESEQGSNQIWRYFGKRASLISHWELDEKITFFCVCSVLNEVYLQGMMMMNYQSINC